MQTTLPETSLRESALKTKLAIDCALATPAIGGAFLAHFAQAHNYITLSNAASLFAIIYSIVGTVIAVLNYRKGKNQNGNRP